MARSRRMIGNWIRFSVDFADHPKALELGPESCWMYVCGLTYSKKYLTDGVVPKGKLPRLCNVTDYEKCVTELIASGLWKWDKRKQNIIIHDYLEWQTSKDEVAETRENSRIRQERARQRQAEQEESRHAHVTRDKGVMSRARHAEVRAQETETETETETEINTYADDFVVRTKEPRDAALVKALIAVCKIEQSDLTKEAMRKVRYAAKQLRDVGASPGEIEARAEIYQDIWPTMALTPMGLVSNWPKLSKEALPVSEIDRALQELAGGAA